MAKDNPTGPLYQLERNGPIVANEMRTLAHAGRYTVVAFQYASQGGGRRVYPHRTLKAAMRTLASLCDITRGKLYRWDEYAAAIVTPSGRVLTYHEARAAVLGDAPMPS